MSTMLIRMAMTSCKGAQSNTKYTNIARAIRRHIPEEGIPHSHGRENFKDYNFNSELFILPVNSASEKEELLSHTHLLLFISLALYNNT
jgi:hypothetical protein